jgi:hypothetical protein
MMSEKEMVQKQNDEIAKLEAELQLANNLSKSSDTVKEYDFKYHNFNKKD